MVTSYDKPSSLSSTNANEQIDDVPSNFDSVALSEYV